LAGDSFSLGWSAASSAVFAVSFDGVLSDVFDVLVADFDSDPAPSSAKATP
jgi:hypothetical protein